MPSLRLPAHYPNITPNPDDENNHCSSCNRFYASKRHYRYHLENVHKMVLPRLRQTSRPTPNPSILPDIRDPNFYCKSCQVKLKTLQTDRTHLRYVHRVALPPLIKRATISDPTISSDDTQDRNKTTVCAICKFQCNSKYTYRHHMKKFHNGERDRPLGRKDKILLISAFSLISMILTYFVAPTKKCI